MAWNLAEIDSFERVRSLLGGQSGPSENSLKVYRTGEKVVVAQYAELDTETILQFNLGKVMYSEDALGQPVLENIEEVDDARRLIVGKTCLALSRAVLSGFMFYNDPSFEMRVTQHLVRKLTNTPTDLV